MRIGKRSKPSWDGVVLSSQAGLPAVEAVKKSQLLVAFTNWGAFLVLAHCTYHYTDQPRRGRNNKRDLALWAVLYIFGIVVSATTRDEHEVVKTHTGGESNVP
jgi:hypothetical protein